MERRTPTDRMIGCRNCQAAAPMAARFCPRCGVAMTVVPPPPAVHETPNQRRLRRELEVERVLRRTEPPGIWSGLWFWLGVVGLICLTGGGESQAIGAVLLTAAVVVMVWNVRMHVRARERAERVVREGWQTVGTPLDAKR